MKFRNVYGPKWRVSVCLLNIHFVTCFFFFLSQATAVMFVLWEVLTYPVKGRVNVDSVVKMVTTGVLDKSESNF